MHFPTLGTAKELVGEFLDTYERDVENWATIGYLHTRHEQLLRQEEQKEQNRLRQEDEEK